MIHLPLDHVEDPTQDGIDVGLEPTDERFVRLTFCPNPDRVYTFHTLTPLEARCLGAMLVHLASEVER